MGGDVLARLQTRSGNTGETSKTRPDLYDNSLQKHRPRATPIDETGQRAAERVFVQDNPGQRAQVCKHLSHVCGSALQPHLIEAAPLERMGFYFAYWRVLRSCL